MNVLSIARRRIALPAVLGFALLAPATAPAAEPQLLLVHGHGSASTGKNCNGDTWADALRAFEGAGGRPRASLTTIGYYPGDKGRCDAMIGDGNASNARPIQDIAKDLAVYIDGRDAPVDIVAHSMGGLITRVALLGSAQHWPGFPAHKLRVENVVTLGTPYQGVSKPSAHDDRQWQQMRPGSAFLERLHEDGLGDAWAAGTDWSLVGSHEDATVAHDSAIDKGRAADQKFGYADDPSDSGEVTHTGIRSQFGQNAYSLTYVSGGGSPHRTDNGWSPLKTAFQAATKVGDNLPG
jgi:pimeloyl-ACP methyl ester carboxylesterase